MLGGALHKTLLFLDIFLTIHSAMPRYSSAGVLRWPFPASSYPRSGFAGLAESTPEARLQEMAHWEHRGSSLGSRLCAFVAAFILGGVHALRIPAQGDTADCSAPLIRS
jgi:hypothetical protein